MCIRDREYTPKSFAESLGLNMDDYIELTSFTHKPYYQMCIRDRLGIGTHYLDLNDKFSGCVFYRAGLYYPIASKLELSGDLGYFHIGNFHGRYEFVPIQNMEKAMKVIVKIAELVASK